MQGKDLTYICMEVSTIYINLDIWMIRILLKSSAHSSYVTYDIANVWDSLRISKTIGFDRSTSTIQDIIQVDTERMALPWRRIMDCERLMISL